MKPIPLSKAKLLPTTHYEPHWFAMSPSMAGMIGQCGEKARLHYVERVRPNKIGIALLRGSIVHHVVENFLRLGAINPDDIIASYMRNDAAAIVDKKVPEGDVWTELQKKYEIPNARQNKEDKELDRHRPAFNCHEFLAQCRESIGAIIEFIVENKLRPMPDPDGRDIIEANMYYPLVDRNGAMMASKVNGDVVTVRNIIDLAVIDSDGRIHVYDWKTGMKRSPLTNGVTPAHTGHALASYAHALFSKIPTYSHPITAHIVRPVTKNDGSFVELEHFERDITREDSWEVVEKYAYHALQIMAVDLHKYQSWNCPSCDYSRLCFLSDKEGYSYTPSKDEEQENTED